VSVALVPHSRFSGDPAATPPPLRRDALIAAAALLLAVTTAWITARAGFLAHPGWLAVQKADLILGPVLVGLYWRRRRPASRFGPLLILAGFAFAPYALQALEAPAAYGVGVLAEGLVGLGCAVLVLTFPNGRLDGRVPRILIAAEALAVLAVPTVVRLIQPHFGADGSLSGCRGACPPNGLSVASDPSLASVLLKLDRGLIVVLALATVALLMWRLATGTPPRRRAFLVGAPIAVFFELCRAGYQGLALISPDPSGLHTGLAWTFALSRSTLWYGFLLALIAAELAAGRVLRGLIADSLHRPSLRDLEAMLRAPLGDPGLRLAFRDSREHAWLDGDGRAIAIPGPSSGQAETVIERAGGHRVILLHDRALSDDPELLRTAGAVLLLALGYRDLEAAWNDAVGQLRGSRARIAEAGNVERRRLERDLHDGAQQRLVAVVIKLGALARSNADPSARAELVALELELEATLAELRELAHGIYPPVLADAGLVPALSGLEPSVPLTITAGPGVGRYPEAIESAAYFCCLEAIQNATKHAGPAARIAIALEEDGSTLRFEVRDSGRGFDPSTAGGGMGLRNMHDRLEAVDGRLVLASVPGEGTVVTGIVPLARFRSASRRPSGSGRETPSGPGAAVS
jgi:signal transduction histidine kinase